MVALLVEHLLQKKCHQLVVDQILLGDIYMVKILTKICVADFLPPANSSSLGRYFSAKKLIQP